MGTYKGNAGHLMQHWTLCELLDIAGKNDTPSLNYIDAHAMAPLARRRDPNPGSSGLVFDGVRRNLPGKSVYQQAWHNLVVRNLCNDRLIGTGPFPGHTGLIETIAEQSGIPSVISRMLVY